MCCSCKHQILGIKSIFPEIIHHCLQILLHCSTCTVEFVSSQWTTFTQSVANSLASLFYQKIVSLKDLISSNCIVVLHLFKIIYLTVVKFFQIPPPSPLPEYLNYFSQCQANHHRSTTSQYHSQNHVPTLPPSSSHTWQTFLSHRLFFHPNSNFFLSCIGFLFATE